MSSAEEESYVCKRNDPDLMFNRLVIHEFPVVPIGLSCTNTLDLGSTLKNSIYIKTQYRGNIMSFEEARQVSPSHRSFLLEIKDNRYMDVTFKPDNQCIAKNKRRLNKFYDNRFMFDLRLIKVDGYRCCNQEKHLEVARYYISGRYEDCKVTHSPKVMSFGEVEMMTQETKHARIRNGCKVTTLKLFYIKGSGYDVLPKEFTLRPKSSIRISVVARPSAFNVINVLQFIVRNPSCPFEEKDDNYLNYRINTEMKVIFTKTPKKEVIVKSLPKMFEQSPGYTYLGKELEIRNKRKEVGMKFLEYSKSAHKKAPKEKKSIIKDFCYPDSDTKEIAIPAGDFCKVQKERVSTHDLLTVYLYPFFIDFGEIALNSFGTVTLYLKNLSKYEVIIRFLQEDYILYQENKFQTLKVTLKPFEFTSITLLGYGPKLGHFTGNFRYTIDNRYRLEHPYMIFVSSPVLILDENNLKFGQVTLESFDTNVHVKIFNNYDIPLDFKWNDIPPEIPFEVIPTTGTVPQHACRICDVIYKCLPTKIKLHYIVFDSKGTIESPSQETSVALNILNRKLIVKFLDQPLKLKVPLNLDFMKQVRLENSSREFVTFFVIQPTLPGVRILPMTGVLPAKSIIFLDVKVKISCVMEFAFDLSVKINSIENVTLPVSGQVLGPEVSITPKRIFMPRMPSELVSFVPVTLQNLGQLRSVVDVLPSESSACGEVFDVYIARGNYKDKVSRLIIDSGQSMTVFIKIDSEYRREYDMYIPFRINEILGPPIFHDTVSLRTHHYTEQFNVCYENNSKAKVITSHKEICNFRITGVITRTWIKLSVQEFEIDYVPNGKNCINFTMTNVSKSNFCITISTESIAPYFSLKVETENNQVIVNEVCIMFVLEENAQANVCLKFHPKGHGTFTATALMYLDIEQTIAFSNLTFIGKRVLPTMSASVSRVIFPPCPLGIELCRTITLKLEAMSDLEPFTCSLKEEPNLKIRFVDYECINGEFTEVKVDLKLCCKSPTARAMSLIFHHECGASCHVEVAFCITYCPLTLHMYMIIKPDENPYPYYPLDSQTQLYEYMETCIIFLEKWLFEQGFRREIYPLIPDALHALSSELVPEVKFIKIAKGINGSYLNFLKRIAGPIYKQIKELVSQGSDDPFDCVKEIHDTYKEIISLLRSRGANLWSLRAKFLLSYNQFIVYTENVTPTSNADIILINELKENPELFNRLNKQTWFDFILQTYKVFVMDSCFFECVCVNNEPRDVTKILINWYNDSLHAVHGSLLDKDKPIKTITNLTTDLSDGVAIISAIFQNCPYLKPQLSLFIEPDDIIGEGSIIHNACLIIETMQLLKMNFPLNSKDLLQPNFLHMLFLSIHLYITLPMYKVKDVIEFSPPLTKSSSRVLTISPYTQEALQFSHTILDSDCKFTFSIEKSPNCEAEKNISLNIKFSANFLDPVSYILMIHGSNKARLFDTYLVFKLVGNISSIRVSLKCKVQGSLYHTAKVDAVITSPFKESGTFRIYQSDMEPDTVPDIFNEDKHQHKFYTRRVTLIDKEISLPPAKTSVFHDPKEEVFSIRLQILCLSSQEDYTWLWFRSAIGDFVVKITAETSCDIALDKMRVEVTSWPMDPCSCGESCECYRTSTLHIPHRNDIMVKALRTALSENASELMMNVFDRLIVTTTGRMIIRMLLQENGTHVSDVAHILQDQNTFRITSKTLLPRLEEVVLDQHSHAVLTLPVTLAPRHRYETNFHVIFTSECGMDVRIYNIIFVLPNRSKSRLILE